MNLILFDIDGTLVTSDGAGHRAADRAFKELYGAGSVPLEMKLHGRTDPDIFTEVASATFGRPPTDDELQTLFSHYMRCFSEDLAARNTLRALPGAQELCTLLHRFPEHILGLETGNLEPVAWWKLGAAGLENYFTFGGFSTDHPVRDEIVRIAIARGKLLIEARGETLEHVFVIGDALQDVRAAHASGAISIAVTTGITSAEEFLPAEPRLIIDSLAPTKELLTVLGVI